MLLFVGFAFILIGEASGSDYCNVAGCPANSHTMCKYPDSVKCPGAKPGITNQQRAAILDLHNELRQRVANGKTPGQPKAANMVKLKWNDEVEKIAQRWANNLPCSTIGHDDCRSTQDGEYCGQNAGLNNLNKRKPNYTFPLVDSINMFYKEVEYLDSGEVDKFTSMNSRSGQSVGHYTQLVWATTTEIGCGVVTDKGDQFFAPVIMICNYKPGGNMRDDPIYLQGEPCSKCPEKMHCSKTFPGLCTAEENEEERGAFEGIAPNSGPLKLLVLVAVAIFIYCFTC